MKIGLISDTHVPSSGPTPPPQIQQIFEGVDLILHAGDVYTQDCIEWLEQIAPVESAMSYRASLAEAAPRVTPPIVVEREGRTIGVVHNLELLGLSDDVYPGSLARYPESRDMRGELATSSGSPSTS